MTDNPLRTYRDRLRAVHGLTADCDSAAYEVGYECGLHDDRLIKDFPIDYLCRCLPSYAWGYYDGYCEQIYLEG